MPNWCDNKLTVTHEDKAMIDRFVNAYMNDKLCSEFLPPIGEDTVVWRVSNWGQKWDIGPGKSEEYGINPTVVDNEASVSFASAWAPPLGLYERLVVLGFDVKAYYFEPGMGFAGRWHNGDDEVYEHISNHLDYPQELQEVFDMQMLDDDSEFPISNTGSEDEKM